MAAVDVATIKEPDAYALWRELVGEPVQFDGFVEVGADIDCVHTEEVRVVSLQPSEEYVPGDGLIGKQFPEIEAGIEHALAAVVTGLHELPVQLKRFEVDVPVTVHGFRLRLYLPSQSRDVARPCQIIVDANLIYYTVFYAVQ